jgi:hypothetical protein
MTKTINQSTIDLLKQTYPNARPGFVEVLVEALEIHAKKNKDYNGAKPLFPATGASLFYDLQRKFGRLYNIIQSEEDPQVSESLIDTALDLGVYSFLMVEKLKEDKKE